ncbi:hypothetical protein BJ878DRAFT_539233 [Calycina marina]|uniref:Uncharacterized protein n=1 Tax=Calycina marina TaxID=1763456 RepID=A0A9P7Z8G6_9HELO|nr:hypothetical protein BJ878DRAFT_539233 [Calycina marina]
MNTGEGTTRDLGVASRSRRTTAHKIAPGRLSERETPPNTATTSVRSLVHSLVPESSHTPRQRRILRRFARELELHLKAVQNLPKQTLIPSPSITTIHTIQDLEPYHSQFNSAGLAVTSAEQRRRMPQEKRDNKLPQKPSLPPIAVDGSEDEHTSSYSLSTDHTVLEWTPPNEQPPPPPVDEASGRPTRHESTIVPADVLYPPPSPLTMASFRKRSNTYKSPDSPTAFPSHVSPKNSLPWLQQSKTVVDSPTYISVKSPPRNNSTAMDSLGYKDMATQGMLQSPMRLTFAVRLSIIMKR